MAATFPEPLEKIFVNLRPVLALTLSAVAVMAVTVAPAQARAAVAPYGPG
jgi:hypothetical protein